MVPPEFSNYDLTQLLTGMPPWVIVTATVSIAAAQGFNLIIAILNMVSSRGNSKQLAEAKATAQAVAEKTDYVAATNEVIATRVNGHLDKLRDELREKDLMLIATKHERDNARQLLLAATTLRARSKPDSEPSE